jgi:hypothetical protein
MSTNRHSRTRRTIHRIKSICSELGYVQRRLFELRTGVPQR